MNDEVLTIKVTEAEVNMIMDALHVIARMGSDTHGHDIAELRDLEHDLMEQVSRHGDGWGEDLEPTDLEGRTFSVAEDDFIDHGMRAREMAKNHNARTFGEFEVGSSKAADRRAERMMKGTASPVDGSSWPLNDPIDW